MVLTQIMGLLLRKCSRQNKHVWKNLDFVVFEMADSIIKNWNEVNKTGWRSHQNR